MSLNQMADQWQGMPEGEPPPPRAQASFPNLRNTRYSEIQIW